MDQPFVTHVQDHSTEATVHFVVKTNKCIQTPKTTFKLTKSVSKSCMVLFNISNNITKYDNMLDILKEYCEKRLAMYDTRLDHLRAAFTTQLTDMKEKAMVIQWIVSGQVQTLTLEEELRARQVDPERYLSLTYRQTTATAVEGLNKEIGACESRLEYLKTLDASQAWLHDLDTIVKNKKRLII